MINEYFTQSVKLLCELANLMETGQGDSAEADDIRDDMDYPWDRMDVPEQDALTRMSGYMAKIGTDYALDSWLEHVDSFLADHDVWEVNTAILIEGCEFIHSSNVIFQNRMIPALLGITKPFECPPVTAHWKVQALRGRNVIVAVEYHHATDGILVRINIATPKSKDQS